jgi:hypothetical protein
MSFEVVEKVLDNGPADRTETLLLVAIAEHADDDGYAWPGVEKIAHRTRCCKRQAIRLIKKLSLDGWIVTLPKSAGESKKVTAYQFNLTKIADRESHDVQIAREKASREENKLRKSKSGDIQIAPEKSGDISGHSQVTFPKSQVTFEPFSGDISRFPILKNRQGTVIEEPSLALTSVEVHAEDFQLTEMDSFLSKKKTPDPRNKPFLKALQTYYEQAAKMRPTWDGSDAKHFSDFLAANPQLTLADFETILTHRAMSNVVHGERPRKWLGDATSYLNAPLDRFNKPTGGNHHGKFNGRSEKALTGAQRFAESVRGDPQTMAQRALGNGGIDEAGRAAGRLVPCTDHQALAQNSKRDR